MKKYFESGKRYAWTSNRFRLVGKIMQTLAMLPAAVIGATAAAGSPAAPSPVVVTIDVTPPSPPGGAWTFSADKAKIDQYNTILLLYSKITSSPVKLIFNIDSSSSAFFVSRNDFSGTIPNDGTLTHCADDASSTEEDSTTPQQFLGVTFDSSNPKQLIVSYGNHTANKGATKLMMCNVFHLAVHYTNGEVVYDPVIQNGDGEADSLLYNLAKFRLKVGKPSRQ